MEGVPALLTNTQVVALVALVSELPLPSIVFASPQLLGAVVDESAAAPAVVHTGDQHVERLEIPLDNL